MKSNKLIIYRNNILRSFVWCSLFMLASPFLAHNTHAQFTEESVEKTSRSVWRIQDETGKAWGTAFAIGKNYLVTNAHVMKSLLENDADRIYLSQEDNNIQITFNRLEVISLTYDLATFTTVEMVSFLYLADDFNPEEEQSLYTVGYPDDSWKLLQQTGDIIENNFSYVIPTNETHHKDNNMRGASGSPIVDSRGDVVAVLYYTSNNMIYGIKMDYVNPLVRGNLGGVCSSSCSSYSCLQKAKDELWKMVDDRDKIAQYQAGSGDGYVRSDHNIDLLTQSAEQGLPIAQQELCLLYLDGSTSKSAESAIYWCQKVAERSPVSGLELALKYYWGDNGLPQNRREAMRLSKRAARQGLGSGQYTFGTFFLNGEGGLSKDIKQAKEWFKKAADNGNKRAQEALKRLSIRSR